MIALSVSFRWFLYLQAALCGLVAGESLPGPCRVWYQSCNHDIGWVCSSERSYQEQNLRPWMGCSIDVTPPIPPPSEQCQVINDTCQFTNSTLECNLQLSSCNYGQYYCRPVNDLTYQSKANLNCQEGSSGQIVPTPDRLCLPVDGQCQWYNPCHYWKGYCNGPYHCGTADEYYSFIFGPMPSCSLPPEGYVEPIVPGECVVKDNLCTWSVCEAYLEWCQTRWECGTGYDAAVYRAGPPPPCPALPSGHTRPPLPGVCRFNNTQGRCTFQEVPPTHLEYDDACVLGTVLCNVPTFKCVADVTAPPPYYATCVRQCNVSNGGCSDDQLCIGRPFCRTCAAGGVVEGHCLNTQNVLCPDTTSQVCLATSSQCVVNHRRGVSTCVVSCLQNNGGCLGDNVCVTLVYKCHEWSKSCDTYTECLSLYEVSKDDCPAGHVRSKHGRCSLGCEDFLIDQNSSMTTCNGCVCPIGLVHYRDRCVDPKECFNLFQNPPPFNPLPLTADQVILAMEMTEDRDVFMRRHDSFVGSIKILLSSSGYPDIQAAMHGYYTNIQFRVAILLSGDKVSDKAAPKLASLVQGGSGSLIFAVKNVTVLESARIGGDMSSQALAIGLVVLCGAIILFVIIMVTVIVFVIMKKRALKFSSGRSSNAAAIMCRPPFVHKLQMFQSISTLLCFSIQWKNFQNRHADNPVSETDSFKYSELRKDSISENSEE